MKSLPKIIIDSSALAYRAKHTLGELSKDESKVGVIFGFFLQIYKLAKDHETNDIIFTWDSPKSLRRDIYPEYKWKRREEKKNRTPEQIEDDNETTRQIDLLSTELIPSLGFLNSYKLEGYEADDIIASVVYTNIDDDFIIATGDEDMYQLLMPGITIKKKSGTLYTENDFTKEYGIPSQRWNEVKAIAGCTSDSIQGIDKVGEVLAIKYLKNVLTPNLKSYQKIRSAEGRSIIERNLKLVTLPFAGCPDIELKSQSSLSLDAFIKICQFYDFQYFLRKENLNKWKEILKLV